MAEYAMVKTPGGAVRYKNVTSGKLVKRASIPPEALQKLFMEKVVEEAPKKSCLFCGAFAPCVRLVNLQAIALCNEHYYGKTIGQVVQHIREQANIKEENTA